MIFRFRALSDENDNFVRDWEVPYDMTLLDFHNYICKDLGYDSTSGASFFVSDANWEKLQEFTLFDMGLDEEEAPETMESAVLGQLIHKNNDRLIYLFDMFNDRSLFLELTATATAEEGVEYPRLTFAKSEAPAQFDAGAGGASDSIFDEALGDFGDFEGDEYYDDEY